MGKKIYYHNLRNKETVILAKVNKGRCSFVIDFGSGNTFITLNSNGYYYHGEKLPSTIKIYRNTSDNIYYIVKQNNNGLLNITLTEIGTSAQYTLLHGYAEVIDVTGLTQLQALNLIYTKEPPIKEEFSSVSVDANVLTEYTCRLPRTQYKAQATLLQLSIRNDSGVGGSALIFLTRMNTGTIQDFTINVVSTDYERLITEFAITGTNNGISFTNSKKYKYAITEVSTTF